VGGLGEHVKQTRCGFLCIPFKIFLLYSSAHAEPAHKSFKIYKYSLLEFTSDTAVVSSVQATNQSIFDRLAPIIHTL